MAELTPFSYRYGDSVLHQFDVRFKISGLLFISIVSLHLGALSLSILTTALALLTIHCRMAFASFFKEIRFFLILMLIILMAHALSSKGTIVFQLYFLTISLQGLYEGALICWRLLLILLSGLLFVATTRPAEIKAAVQWFFNPIPFVSGKRLATMLSLMLRFIPVILNQAREISDAQKARCVENRKNPLYRLKKMGFPLLRRTFENADRLIFAMEARCYNERRTDPDFSSSPKDWLRLVCVSVLCGLLLLI